VVAEQPEVARFRDGLDRRLGRLVLGRVGLAIGGCEQRLQLAGIEAQKVEIEALVPQPGQLLCKERLIPPAVQSKLIIRDHIRPLLRRRQMPEPDHRHLGQPQLPGRHQPAVPGEDAISLVDQDRVGEAELDHRGRDLRHLVGAMCPRVALVGPEPVDRPELQPLGQGCQCRRRGDHRRPRLRTAHLGANLSRGAHPWCAGPENEKAAKPAAFGRTVRT
jgi:hypothetical protein